MKNKENGTIPNNYRPITCLPTTFKLLTTIIISDEELLILNESKSEYNKKELKNRQERWGTSKIKLIMTFIYMELAENDELKKETVGFLIAAQLQALRTNDFKAKIDKVTEDSKCQLCKKKDETMDHLISSCSEIAQTDYKKRHNTVASILH